MQMKGDPHWITSNMTIVCAGTIRKGSKAFFYPHTQTGYCTDTDCGIKHAADFEAHAKTRPATKLADLTPPSGTGAPMLFFVFYVFFRFVFFVLFLAVRSVRHTVFPARSFPARPYMR